MIITKQTPIAALTVGQFEELFLQRVNKTDVQEQTDDEKHYVYGIRGIAQLFGCSLPTAQRYKDSFLKPAVYQRGRVIVTDVVKAMKLFSENRGEG